MDIETKSMHITPVEAARMLAETDRAISEKLAIKENLMSEISVWIISKELKQAEAAE